MDMEVIRKLDQQVVDQQLFLEKASVPGFTVTNNPTDIQLQMYLLGFIATISRSSSHVWPQFATPQSAAWPPLRCLASPWQIIFRPASTRPAKSHASRVRLTHFRWVSRSHSAQWKSHAFSCTTKNNIFMSQVFSFCGKKWEFSLPCYFYWHFFGLLIFMCGSIRHTAQWQCPGSKLVHTTALCWIMTVQVSTRSWQHIDTIYGLWHCVHLVYAGLATLISYTYMRLIDSVL